MRSDITDLIFKAVQEMHAEGITPHTIEISDDRIVHISYLIGHGEKDGNQKRLFGMNVVSTPMFRIKGTPRIPKDVTKEVF